LTDLYPPQVLAVIPGFMPSTFICIVKPLLKLHRAGRIAARITLESLVRKKVVESKDLVIFCRNTEPRYSHILNIIKERGIRYIYDLDDNLFDVPVDTELGKYHRNPSRIAMLTNYLQSADLVRVYSEPLLKRVLSLNQKVEKVSGPVDWSLISNRKRISHEKIRIVFATARVYDDMAEIVMPALTRVLNTFGPKIEIHFWGTSPPFLSSLSNIKFHPLISDYDKFLRRFSDAGFDIGLAPLKDDVFYRSKTNNKFREYGACRVAGIYSDMDVYSSCVSDAETGLLVSNDPEAWYGAIVRLVEHLDLREKIKENAFKYVRQHYSQEDFENIWWDQIKKVLSEKDSSSILSPSVRNISSGQGLRIEKAVRCDNQEEESTLNIINRKLHNLFHHLQQYGVQMTFWLVRRSLYNYWMVLKLRMLTSTAAKIFWRK